MNARPYITFGLALVVLSNAAAMAEGDDPLSYNRDIRPILSDNCFACHGPDAKQIRGDLRLDLREQAVRANEQGRAAIVPGDPDASELIRRIHHDDAEERMPPAESHKTLSEGEKRLLRRWIAADAPYEGHWAFQAVREPPLPIVERASWARNPIDRFILARLEGEGLTPSPQADRETLIRRVAFDVTGLPPTAKEIDAFVNDPSENAYEKMVDRYLARPAYGERMALAWMDAARYGDSSVFHADGPRDMWAWRDWVIRAYNENMPFDRFTIEQLAGDLLPDATPWQRIASGFNRNHGTTDEGGVIPEEARVDYVVDRVKTTTNVWLGVSMECAQCHDHKYDPVTQKEYYAFYAFFNQTIDPGMQSRQGNQAPVAEVPDPARDAQVAEIEKQIAEVVAKRKTRAETIDAAFEEWNTEASAKARDGNAAPLPGGMIAHSPLDETEGQAALDAAGDRGGTVKGEAAWTEGKVGGGFHTDNSTFIDFGETANFDRTDRFSYGCWIKPDGDGNGVPLSKMSDQDGYRGWDLYLAGGQVAVHLIHSWPDDALKVTTDAKIEPNEWTHVFVTYDGSSKAAGVKIYFNGEEQKWRVEQDRLEGTTRGPAPLQVGRRHPGSPFNGIVDEVRIYDRTLSASEVGQLAGHDPIGSILALSPEQRTEEQLEQLRNHYLNSVDETYTALQEEKTRLEAKIATIKESVVTSMVMQEQDEPRKTYLLMRGHYASPDESEVIEPNVPEAIGSLPEDAPVNRLGLAQWLVSGEHPLTARVTVNRYWSMFFGKGIVGTVMDFGSQGDWPTHPRLLDWLAADFVEHGWDVKRTIKQMLMSATYRQSSVTTPLLAERDPTNELLSRGPRLRLQGEFIRDAALAVSGLLVDKVGGPGVKPYQPPGLWNEVSLDGNVRFVQDEGDKLYRKSMYIYWKRSAPHPGMLIFDAPTRERCVVQRERTNTPLQALYTMNDTQFIEAARVFAHRMMTQGGETPEQRIIFAYRLATSRHPSEQALETLRDLYETERSRYRSNVERAKRLLSIGEYPRNEDLDVAEHAAWTVVASAILNTDAALTRF